MPKLYFYKLTVDSGGAPCVDGSLLSLAICKPTIRTSAEPGDLVFGFAANSLHRDNRLLYIAEVTEKVRNGDYYLRKRFEPRGDCIYEWRGDHFEWRKGALHHGPNDVKHDLGEHPGYPRANVLLSSEFRYFGKDGTADYKARYPLVKLAVEHLGQGHRVPKHERLRQQLLALKQEIWNITKKKVAGSPSSRVRRQACHRSRYCGVIIEPGPA
ncbi:MAG: hypothetical protein HY423_16235 [Candidatus Lambdaproteobacteria bacterium]|nr:hypothetical protein [Candidatus Lambdaproteobacteria bacterium]